MPTSPSRRARRRLASAVVVTAALAPLALAAPQADAAAAKKSARASVDLGRPGLPESRKVTRVESGVAVTSIVRGQKAATPATRGTTQNGPWRIKVATIDPKRAKGHLRTAIGADIARTEGVSVLGKWSKSPIAVNGSFFSAGRRTAPGDMVGVAVNGGTIISQPQRVAGHMGVLMDSRTKALRMDNYSWKSTITSDAGELFLDAVNTPVAVPKGCEQMTDAASCPISGPLVRFTPHYAGRTPSGVGAEVVFDRKGCVISARTTRGAKLSASQTSIQATGARAADLLRVAGSGCPTYQEKLFGSDRKQVELSRTTFGVAGRYQLVREGKIVAPTAKGSFFGRHPRTIIGRTAGGSVMLVTVDGRSTASVGVTLTEAARLAKSLGMVDAANLDGGGSTAMAVRGKLVNTPAGSRERSVGDAIILLP
ncbi:phosphodiester glycosidase family protein [Mobilicoccus caccae]|uniref:Phosphodiester glycosidase domain-containing protein n=1 Tax=Mobilicoccus caccae TaxID=1859295 RepID=A0ABQ6ISA2_9MICO|nr:phosphodiester glycosidase family protein [Mobilicoccus caccae]GMA40810.1 hypothetical protein GCM10025883_28550 [Mobilicoccus caccae]